MTTEEYLASYCISTDCTKVTGDCDLCMYNKGVNDFMNKALTMLKEEQDTRYSYLDCMDIREIAEQLRRGEK